MFHQAIHNEVAIDIPKYATPTNKTGRNKHNMEYTTVQCHTQSYQKSFLPRTITEWNGLNHETINQPTVGQFKSSLEKHIFAHNSLFFCTAGMFPPAVNVIFIKLDDDVDWRHSVHLSESN